MQKATMRLLLLLSFLVASDTAAQKVTITTANNAVEARVDGKITRIAVDRIGDLNQDGYQDYIVGDQPGAWGRLGRFVIFGEAGSHVTIPNLARIDRRQGSRILPPYIRLPSGSSMGGGTGAKKTTTATSPVVDVNELPAGSNVNNVAVFDNTVYFSAFDPDTGYELSRLSGSSVETIVDLVAGHSSSYPSSLTEFQEKLVFTAYVPETGRELYEYDGVEAIRLTDIAVGPGDGIVDFGMDFFGGTLYEAQNKLYFLGSDATGKYHPFVYDGSTISQLKNPQTQETIENVWRFMVYNDALLFFQSDQESPNQTLYSLKDGVLSTVNVFENSFSFYLYPRTALFNGKLVFDVYENYEQHLYTYDGTTVAQIELSGTEDISDPVLPVAVGNKLYFIATTETTGEELFVYDGTTTSLVIDLAPGEDDANIWFMTGFGNRLFFNRFNYSTLTWDLYVYDGTTLNKWSDLDDTDFFPWGLYPIGNTLFASAYSTSHGTQLWTLSGNSSTRLTSQSEATLGSSPEMLTVIGEALYFGATADMTTGGLYRYDGSLNLIADVDAGTDHSYLKQAAEYNGKILFMMVDQDGVVTLYSTDGSTTTTVATNTSNEMAVFNGKLYFGATDGTTEEVHLHVYDGTAVTLAPDLAPTPPVDIALPVVYGGKLYFGAYSPATGYELFSYNGTNSVIAADIMPSSASGGPLDIAILGNVMYLVAGLSGGSSGMLFSFDGTTVQPVGTILINCTVAGQCLEAVEGDLYYRGLTMESKYELFRVDGTEGTQITNGMARWGTEPLSITGSGGKVFFSGEHYQKGRELFVYDGTDVSLKTDLYPGYEGSYPDYLVAFNNRIYFSADEPYVGNELFSVDLSGTVDAEDPVAGAALALSQSYPNPTRGATNLAFTLPKPEQVVLSVYDLMGRRVSVLVNGMYPAGTHPVSFQAAGLQNGMYFIRLEAGGQSLVSKMVVVR